MVPVSLVTDSVFALGAKNVKEINLKQKIHQDAKGNFIENTDN